MVKGLVQNMKALIKKANLKLFLVILGLVIFEAFIFFLTKPFIRNPYILGSMLDNKIPFVSQFVWIYVFWYTMLLWVPYYIFTKNKDSFYKYTVTFVITTLIAGVIFVSFPNTVVRANIIDNNLSSQVVKIIYALDSPGINCLPSIHCLYSFLFIFGVLDTKSNSPKWMKILVSTLSILVVLSTLFIKQHVIYDAIAAFVIGFIIWIIVDKCKLYIKINLLDKVIKISKR